MERTEHPQLPRTYLGDGLYCQDEGFQFVLFTERENGTHFVGLDNYVLDAFIQFIEKQRKVKIEVSRNILDVANCRAGVDANGAQP